MMERPTLEEQIAISKLSDEECIEIIKPPRIGFWISSHLPSLWHIIHWNWFDIWCESEKEVADRNRCWVIKLKLKLFGGNK